MIQCSLDLRSPEERRDAGIAQVAASNESFVERVIEDVIRPLARSGHPFTADHVRVVAHGLGIGEPSHPNGWGAPMALAHRRGIIEPGLQLVKSVRPVAHAHSNRSWRRGEAA